MKEKKLQWVLVYYQSKRYLQYTLKAIISKSPIKTRVLIKDLLCGFKSHYFDQRIGQLIIVATHFHMDDVMAHWVNTSSLVYKILQSRFF